MSRCTNRFTLTIAAAFIAACQPQSPAQPAASAPSAADTAAPATATTAAPPPADTTLERMPPPAGAPVTDAAALAGQFRGTVPCADCPGIETVLQLNLDGSYSLEETYLERGGPRASAGTWTLEGDRIRLDPDAKDADDRLYAAASNDELRQLDLQGQRIPSDHNYSLRRASSAQ